MSHNLALNWLYSLIVKIESEEIVVTEETMEALETVDSVETVENAYFPTLCPWYMQTQLYPSIVGRIFPIQIYKIN